MGPGGIHEAQKSTSLELIGGRQRLFELKLAASASDDILGRAFFHELEAIAECASLASGGEDVDVAKGKRKFQANDFSDGNFNGEDGGNARFAEIDGVSSNYWAITCIDADPDFQFEPTMTPRFEHIARLMSSNELDSCTPVSRSKDRAGFAGRFPSST